ncbi:MAG: NADH-quinone oxidoreductase subunit A [Candidatus Hydrothermarchaeales archaeon]
MTIYEYYIPVAIFIIVGLLFPIAAMVSSWLFRVKNPYPEKLTTFECGEIPIGNAQIQFDIQYYMFAILFVVFDIETVFLYPWALVFPELGMLAVLEMILFIAILALGLIYAWKKGVLEWMPLTWRD